LRDLIGSTLGHYRIVEQIGAGGMGVVYRAHDERLDRDVAIKVLPEEVAQSGDRLARFEREAKAVAQLAHPNILEIWDFGSEDGTPYAVMELLEGESLRKVIGSDGLSTGKAVDYALAIADGLAAAHDKGIIHRDLKPENAFLTKDGRVKILDFGLAKLRVPDADLTTETPTQTLDTAPGGLIGTIPYMAPEQVQGHPADHRSDIFALGVVLYEMLTGQRPFRGSSTVETAAAILKEDPEVITLAATGMAPGIANIVSKCLEKEPAKRFQTAAELAEELRLISRQPLSSSAPAFTELVQKAKKPKFAVIAFVVLAAFVLLTYFTLQKYEKERWAREIVIPEIENLIEDDNYAAAFSRAVQIEEHSKTDDDLKNLWPRMSQYLSIKTTPSNADVIFRSCSADDVEEHFIGESPIERIRIPLGPYWVRIEKAGFGTVNRLYRGIDHYDSPETVREYEFVLAREGSAPPGMVQIPETTVEILEILLERETVQIDPFLIDTYEVTNREYKEFVDGGGYRNPEYWEHDFVKDGRVLSFEDAVEEFRDRTGRRGPSTWEVGTFPEGHDNYPVSGVSWYEAAAYAKYSRKRLPTIYHWKAAADPHLATYVIPGSNFSNQGSREAGSGPPEPFGTYDMAGNVKEWCWNSSEDLRFVLGGGWNEPIYAYTQIDVQPPFTRSATFGFRCVKYLDDNDTTLENLARSIPVRSRSPLSIESVSDQIFEAYISQYEYDPSELNSAVESIDESTTYWTRERITFDATYDDERIIAYLFLPKNVAPPYQTVIFFPGSGALEQRSIEGQVRMFDFIVKSGRAVMFPIYKGTLERRNGFEFGARDSRKYSENVINWMNEVRRSIDYLQTRPEIDIERLAYYGFSWGSRLGSIALSLDSRLRLAVFLDGGVGAGSPRPEVMEANFAPRVDVPVLMINGRNDSVFPLETRQMPLLSLLGTPEEHKRHILYESGHCVIGFWKNQVVSDILDWLDHYFGRPDGAATLD
jgi:serine/threonine protein kinase/formylglycine-generating enzyme required for sulfatase activity/dienelactone hydrolase